MKKKKTYEKPQLTEFSYKSELGYAGSGIMSGTVGLGNSWSNNGNDAWGDDVPSGGNSFGGGWTDNGGNAWK